MRFTLIAAVSFALAGCSTFESANPINWWHKQQGGKIAQERPTPPGADQTYPNLSTVPAKPTAPDQDALKKLTASLVADRTNAQHAAQTAPIADPSSPSASPGLFGTGSAPPPPPPGLTPVPNAAAGKPTGTAMASASIPAATAPPPPAAPPAAAPPPQSAPRKAVQSAPLDTPAAPASATPAAATPTSATPAPPAQFAAAAQPQPALPEAPPPRPAAAGVPPPPLPAPSPMPLAGAKSADIAFVTDAAALSSAASDEVKSFAAQRGNAVIGVTGYGDAAANDLSTQSAALNLGLARAQAIADALKAAGVPGNAIRVSAEASGRGASLHLLQ